MDWHALNWLDYTIIGIIALSSIISLIRGFVREALSLASWIVAFWVALTFAQSLSNHLEVYIHEPTMRIGVSFFALFAATLIVGAMVNFLVTQIVDKTGLSGTDRILGVVFGFGRGILLVAALLLFARFTPVSQDHTWQQSQLVPSFQPLENWIDKYIPEKIKPKKMQAKNTIPATSSSNSTTMNISPTNATEG